MSPHGTNVYRKITDALDEIDYSKIIASRKKKRSTDLPANTYVAEFEEDGTSRAKEIVKLVEDELREIFRRFEVHGNFFVSVGKRWAWRVGQF
jgi:hypothetical protein